MSLYVTLTNEYILLLSCHQTARTVCPKTKLKTMARNVFSNTFLIIFEYVLTIMRLFTNFPVNIKNLASPCGVLMSFFHVSHAANRQMETVLTVPRRWWLHQQSHFYLLNTYILISIFNPFRQSTAEHQSLSNSFPSDTILGLRFQLYVFTDPTFATSAYTYTRQACPGLPVFPCSHVSLLPWWFHVSAYFVMCRVDFLGEWPIQLHFFLIIWCSTVFSSKNPLSLWKRTLVVVFVVEVEVKQYFVARCRASSSSRNGVVTTWSVAPTRSPSTPRWPPSCNRSGSTSTTSRAAASKAVSSRALESSSNTCSASYSVWTCRSTYVSTARYVVRRQAVFGC